MKKLLSILAFTGVLVACNDKPKTEEVKKDSVAAAPATPDTTKKDTAVKPAVDTTKKDTTKK